MNRLVEDLMNHIHTRIPDDPAQRMDWYAVVITLSKQINMAAVAEFREAFSLTSYTKGTSEGITNGH